MVSSLSCMPGTLYCAVQDVQDVLQQHGAVLDQLPADFQPHQVVSTASNLLRMLKVITAAC